MQNYQNLFFLMDVNIHLMQKGTLEYKQNTKVDIWNSKSMQSHCGQCWNATVDVLDKLDACNSTMQ